MLNTSADILNIILAISIAVLTFFLCWALYYFIVSVQKIYNLTRRIEVGVSKAEEILDLAKNKLKNSSAYFMILAEVAKRALDFVKEKSERKASSKTSSKSKK